MTFEKKIHISKLTKCGEHDKGEMTTEGTSFSPQFISLHLQQMHQGLHINSTTVTGTS